MKNKIRSIKNHVARNRFKYGVATGLSAGLYITYRSNEQHNQFLMDEGLYDKFYAVGEEF